MGRANGESMGFFGAIMGIPLGIGQAVTFGPLRRGEVNVSEPPGAIPWPEIRAEVAALAESPDPADAAEMARGVAALIAARQNLARDAAEEMTASLTDLNALVLNHAAALAEGADGAAQMAAFMAGARNLGNRLFAWQAELAQHWHLAGETALSEAQGVANALGNRLAGIEQARLEAHVNIGVQPPPPAIPIPDRPITPFVAPTVAAASGGGIGLFLLLVAIAGGKR